MTGAEVSSVSGNTGVNSRSPCSLARSRMASIHSSLSRILHSRPSHQVFRIYLTPSRSVTDNAPSFVASNRSAGTVPRSSRCFRTCSCRHNCSSLPVYSLKIRQPCCVSHRIAPLPFGYAILLSHTAPAVPPLCHSLTTPPKIRP